VKTIRPLAACDRRMPAVGTDLPLHRRSTNAQDCRILLKKSSSRIREEYSVIVHAHLLFEQRTSYTWRPKPSLAMRAGLAWLGNKQTFRHACRSIDRGGGTLNNLGRGQMNIQNIADHPARCLRVHQVDVCVNELKRGRPRCLLSFQRTSCDRLAADFAEGHIACANNHEAAVDQVKGTAGLRGGL
jgi:hypothetical protein